jgi:ABC-2 type transport system ATP-binding protein
VNAAPSDQQSPRGRGNPGNRHYNTETSSHHFRLRRRTNLFLTRNMDSIVLESVSKIFQHRPALFNWMGRERSGNTQALAQVSLSVARGKVLVLLGPNGSGKTTTLKLVSTMLLPDAGRVMVEGADTRTEPHLVRKHVGFAIASERSFFPRLSARENLDFFAALDDVPRKSRAQHIEDMLARTGLLDAADTLVMKFSSGMYQRLGMARALIKKPSVILLDEPTRSLDPASVAHFWNLVRELPAEGSTVILATHSFNEAAAVGDSVAVLHQGRLAAYRTVGGSHVESLRSFYFQTTGELDESAELMPRNFR